MLATIVFSLVLAAGSLPCDEEDPSPVCANEPLALLQLRGTLGAAAKSANQELAELSQLSGLQKKKKGNKGKNGKKGKKGKNGKNGKKGKKGKKGKHTVDSNGETETEHEVQQTPAATVPPTPAPNEKYEGFPTCLYKSECDWKQDSGRTEVDI